MKLTIVENSQPKPVKEKEVFFSLRKHGENISLILQKEGESEQSVLMFNDKGEVTKISTYCDIGFQRDENGRLKIS